MPGVRFKIIVEPDIVTAVSEDESVPQEGEAELLERLQALAPQYRTRPSALLPLVRATGSALGALSAVLPRPYSEAIKGVIPTICLGTIPCKPRRNRAHGCDLPLCQMCSVGRTQVACVCADTSLRTPSIGCSHFQ